MKLILLYKWSKNIPEMAHSGRKEKKYGGSTKKSTRHQEMKSQRSSKQAERLRNTVAWAEEFDRRKEVKQAEHSKSKRVRRPDMRGNAKKRRSLALQRLQVQLGQGTKILSAKGIVKMSYEEFEALSNMPSDPIIVVPLTEADKVRIQKEMKILVSRGAIVFKQPSKLTL